jgi:hypothetical protein
MQIEGRVGLISAANGSVNPLRTSTNGALVTNAYGGKLADAALTGRLFSVCNQGAVAVTAALATTWTGLGVANPTGSGKNLIFHEFGWAQTVVNPAEGAIGLMTTTDSGMAAALTVRSCMYGNGVSVAYADDGATIATPILERIVGGTMEGAISTIPSQCPSIYRIDGGIILSPGRSLLTYHTIGGTASLVFYFVWEEVAE